MLSSVNLHPSMAGVLKPCQFLNAYITYMRGFLVYSIFLYVCEFGTAGLHQSHQLSSKTTAFSSPDSDVGMSKYYLISLSSVPDSFMVSSYNKQIKYDKTNSVTLKSTL
uniref:Uncharacterized protein n=1 Tax=Cuerna arida TaxID=1464854 RepID=A0A1B6ES74_9HEMI